MSSASLIPSPIALNRSRIRGGEAVWFKSVALVSFNIPLARPGFLTSRASSFIRRASLVVMPLHTPASTSERLTHSFKVCGTQPILGAMDSMAAHNDWYFTFEEGEDNTIPRVRPASSKTL